MNLISTTRNCKIWIRNFGGHYCYDYIAHAGYR
jgi:hypothetical protein